jgi:hypothetical protein
MNVILTGVNELPAPGDDTVAREQAFFDADLPLEHPTSTR